MKFSELINSLADANIDSPEIEAAILVENYVGIKKSQLIINRDAEINSPGLEKALSKRLAGEPLQYILGEWYFMSEKYQIGSGCLIPRGDTEILCEEVIKYLPDKGKLLDLCTGSGCVAISALIRRPASYGEGIEKYGFAAEYARKNARLHNIEDRFKIIEADVLTYTPIEMYDVISANPPYIPYNEMKTLKAELHAEPSCALTDGGDGLSFYRHIIPSYLPFLKKNGRLIMEMGAGQAPDVLKISEEHGGICEIKKDYNGIDRVIIIKNHE